MDRLAEGKARGKVDGNVRVLTVHDVLCKWHDAAVDPDEECRMSGRRRVIRWLVRQAARDEKKAEIRTFDPQQQGLIDPTTKRSDENDRKLATIAAVRAASDPLDRLIFDMHFSQGLTLQEVKDELMASGRRLSIPTIHRRAKRVAAAVRAAWESGSQADE